MNDLLGDRATDTVAVRHIPSDAGIQVAAIHKADGAEIRVMTSVYKGRRVVDVRVWYQPVNSVEYAPTRKGVTFDADKLPD